LDADLTGQPGLVSVIVPTRNSAAFLAQCLDAIKNQTYRNIEIIVVDNHSLDATAEIARSYTSKVFVHGPERSAQVNFGVRRSDGEYVYKVDSDFVLEPLVVESCVAEIAKGFDAVVVHNSPDVRVSWIARIRKFEVDMYKYNITHSSARFVKKRVYNSIGGFDENITAGEDYDFQNRLNAAGYKTGFVAPEALHLGEPTSFWGHMKRYYHYGSDFVAYARQNQAAAGTQLGFIRVVYLANWRRFVRHPLNGGAFIVYNICKFAFGGAGFLVGSVKTWSRGHRPS
jgi:glycosyltransferase involved in cell wall biosynthesis